MKNKKLVRAHFNGTIYAVMGRSWQEDLPVLYSTNTSKPKSKIATSQNKKPIKKNILKRVPYKLRKERD